MKRDTNPYLALLICGLIFFQMALPQPLWSEVRDAYLLIVPVADNDLDEETREIAEHLHSRLSGVPNLKIIPEEKVKEILGYHNGALDPEKPENEFETALLKAKEAYHTANIRQARDSVQGLIRQMEKGGAWRAHGRLLQEAYLLKAVCDWSFREREAVRSSFTRILRINPLFDLDRQMFSPGLVQLFGNVRSEFHNGASGTLIVDASPAGAEILMNGIRQCISPCREMKLPTGEYSVEIKLNHYETVWDIIRIAPDKITRHKKNLVWKDNQPKQDTEWIAGEGTILNKIRKAVSIGKTIHTDKIILVNADAVSKSNAVALFRIVDILHGAGQHPLSLKFKRRRAIPPKRLKGLTSALLKEIHRDLSGDPSRFTDPKGLGDASLLGKRKKKLTKQPAFWAGVGAAVLTGILLGIFATGGGSKAPASEQTKIKLRIE